MAKSDVNHLWSEIFFASDLMNVMKGKCSFVSTSTLMFIILLRTFQSLVCTRSCKFIFEKFNFYGFISNFKAFDFKGNIPDLLSVFEVFCPQNFN